MIRGAAEGNAEDRDRFARRYLPVLRIYLRARWRGTPLAPLLEEAGVLENTIIVMSGDHGMPFPRCKGNL